MDNEKQRQLEYILASAKRSAEQARSSFNERQAKHGLTYAMSWQGGKVLEAEAGEWLVGYLENEDVLARYPDPENRFNAFKEFLTQEVLKVRGVDASTSAIGNAADAAKVYAAAQILYRMRD